MGLIPWNLLHQKHFDRQNGCSTRRRLANLVVFVLVFMAVSDPGRFAYAYLDPGTSGILLQMILGGAAGVVVVAKLYWSRFTGMFRRSGEPAEGQAESRSE